MILCWVDRWLRFLFLRLQLRNQMIKIGDNMASRTIGTTMTAVSSLLVRLLSGLAIDVFACSEALGVVVVRANAVVVAMGVRVIVGRGASTIMLGGKV